LSPRVRILIGTVGLLVSVALWCAEQRAIDVRRDYGSVAGRVRAHASGSSLLGGGFVLFFGFWELWLPGAWLAELPACRRRQITSRVWLVATAVWFLPVFAALIFVKALYWPLDKGGVADPITRPALRALELAWLLVALAWMTWMAVVAKRAARLATQPRCDQCGYDLTGNVSGKCPECGTPTGRAASG
jgi:hypothetical protein